MFWWHILQPIQGGLINIIDAMPLQLLPLYKRESSQQQLVVAPTFTAAMTPFNLPDGWVVEEVPRKSHGWFDKVQLFFLWIQWIVLPSKLRKFAEVMFFPPLLKISLLKACRLLVKLFWNAGTTLITWSTLFLVKRLRSIVFAWISSNGTTLPSKINPLGNNLTA